MKAFNQFFKVVLPNVLQPELSKLQHQFTIKKLTSVYHPQNHTQNFKPTPTNITPKPTNRCAKQKPQKYVARSHHTNHTIFNFLTTENLPRFCRYSCSDTFPDSRCFNILEKISKKIKRCQNVQKEISPYIQQNKHTSKYDFYDELCLFQILKPHLLI
eukprot:TRINITY_DN5468_c0_g1_i3.p2 TRINITY_DN5468_c0_g1~~TRINITY_DN5468_c0_g1_i3.p2  ORF type:complete len:179 (+),score=4.78 TRINITY_DN5468_c0_g1_i3:65-538(+)